ncbi:M14 family metallopeptidase [Bremerella sp. JC770]|uniref:M14 family metallopeptidase n=1 Tax=Bremerella sp. JC770 TaxID=3232137 RepID=UPI00345B11B0
MLQHFSQDYVEAQTRFREAATKLGFSLESHSIGVSGPDGNELAFDVACSHGDARRVLVISSGVHGVEGYFGSAVQLGLLEMLSQCPDKSDTKVILLHGLNAYGFAWDRRFNEDNVDPNRNFLLPGQTFTGSPPGYAELDGFLNPQRPPSIWEPFTAKAAWLIAQHGMKKLRGAIASGQYDFPQGLFFGGHGPSRMQTILQQNMPRWLAGSEQVIHLDFHTGLGAWGTWKLLIDYKLADWQREVLGRFGPDCFETNLESDIAYDAKGGFGQWCIAQQFAPKYVFGCAEFGTYPSVKVLAGLRAENQAHHWGSPGDAKTRRTKRRLRNLFCPTSQQWRTTVMEESLNMIGRAIDTLERSWQTT